MALRADRQIDAVNTDYFMNEVAQRGSFPVIKTAGSGISMDNVKSVCTIAANSSGNQPLGCLMEDVVSIDLTRYPINWHKDQANSGDKVCLLTKGWIVTDQVTGTPTAGTDAVLSSSGTVAGSALGLSTYNGAANPKVGRFRTGLDQAGFAKVYVDL